MLRWMPYITFHGILLGRLHLKIPEAFEASFVVTVQLVADPRGTVHLKVDSLIHVYVKHVYHDHFGLNLVVLIPACLFELFPFYVVYP